ncbi:MAG: prolipoprotein diacylglyceryl transferase [Patescibacteria group bacterium]|nr:MAG: prolipoprotein diacylglyceryl transferase [Patescibacteria group bacterium]
MPSFYGITISIAILVCLTAASKIFPHRKDIWDFGLYCIIGGILGARLYHIVDYWHFYLERPGYIFMVWHGGLGIWGAVIGGILGLYIYTSTYKKSFLETADIAALVLPLGQAIGRWGNFFNSEISGSQTSLPWNLEGKHPIFLYESLLNLLLFFLLFRLSKKVVPAGYLLSSYLAGYGLIRFFLEYLRVNPWKIGALNVAQMLSILSIVISVQIFNKKRLK